MFAALTMPKCLIWVTIVLAFGNVLCVDLNYSEIYTVDEETRFIVLNPDTELVAFNKQRNVKGNFIFTAGERIPGDRLCVNFLDETKFTKSQNIEVTLQYPAKGLNGATITAIEISVDLSALNADAFFFDGGISQKYAHILLACDQTSHYTYEIFIYGY